MTWCECTMTPAKKCQTAQEEDGLGFHDAVIHNGQSLDYFDRAALNLLTFLTLPVLLSICAIGAVASP